MARIGAVVVAVLALGACSDGGTRDYDEAYRADFLERCTGAYDRVGGPQVCGCWHDSLVQNVEFADLPAVDDLLGDDFTGAPDRLPGNDRDLPLRLLAGCVRGLGAEPTLGEPVPLPTQPRPPTTPPTTTAVP